jgi:thiol-disulfide isomerase/thioredoxin
MKRSTIATLIGILLLALNVGAADKPQPLKIGEPAPDFNLPGVDGKQHTLQEYDQAELLVVVFTCNHCPTAQAYEDRIIQITKDYKGNGVAVVAISPNDPLAVRLNEMGYSDLGDTLEDNKLRAEHKKFNFPYLYDGANQEVSRAYGPRSTPHVFIFDKERKLRYQGGVDNSDKIRLVKEHYVRDTLDALLAGKPVPKETTPAFGCSIKWSDKRVAVEDYMKKIVQEEVELKPIGPEGIAAIMKNDTGKLRLVNLWATWCGPCREEFPDLVAIKRMYSHRDFELITINVDNPTEKDKVLEFLQSRQASGQNYIFNDEDKNLLIQAMESRWPGVLPYTILIEPGGRIVFTREGVIDPLETKRAIVDIIGRTYK